MWSDLICPWARLDVVIDELKVNLCIAQTQINREDLKWELYVTTI